MKQTDRILISKIDCVAAIGVTAEERTMKQRLSIDLEFTMDARKAAKSDSLRDAVDYSRVAKAVAQVCGGREFRLIETVAERIADRVLKDFPIEQVRVLVRKIGPVVDPAVAHVAVQIIRP